MSDRIDVMYRLIWNMNGWRAPSGEFLEAEYTWGSQNGFGHEEWNFQRRHAVDDYVFGYVFARPARIADKLPKFRVVFYSKPPDGQWLLVGEYSEAEVVTKNDIARMDQYFEDNSIYDERAEQLVPLTLDRTEFLGRHDFTKLGLSRRRKIIRSELKGSVTNGFYLLKCPVHGVIPYPGGIPAKPKLLKQLLSRGKQYIYPFYPSKSVRAPPIMRDTTSKAIVQLNEGSYWRLSSPTRRRVLKRHNIMSNRFADWLKTQTYQGVSQENNRVDVEFRSGEDLCRAELKICGDGKPLWSIREAVGQLLQYNLYGNRQPAKHWFIVLDEKPDPWDFDFIEALRENYDMPIWLGWQENGNFKLEKMP